LEFNTEYVCIFDDDTIPGPRWFENCLETIDRYHGLVGAAGVVFPSRMRRPCLYFGWRAPGREVRRVDIVGHCWFLRRDWLRWLALEPRPAGVTTAGEDYHVSVALQKHLGLASYTAPHPEDDLSRWGSTAGCECGDDRNALWRREGEEGKRRLVHDFYRAAGWKLLCELGDWESLSRPGTTP
jgi:hypothetical protein